MTSSMLSSGGRGQAPNHGAVLGSLGCPASFLGHSGISESNLPACETGQLNNSPEAAG